MLERFCAKLQTGTAFLQAYQSKLETGKQYNPLCPQKDQPNKFNVLLPYFMISNYKICTSDCSIENAMTILKSRINVQISDQPRTNGQILLSNVVKYVIKYFDSQQLHLSFQSQNQSSFPKSALVLINDMIMDYHFLVNEQPVIAEMSIDDIDKLTFIRPNEASFILNALQEVETVEKPETILTEKDQFVIKTFESFLHNFFTAFLLFGVYYSLSILKETETTIHKILSNEEMKQYVNNYLATPDLMYIQEQIQQFLQSDVTQRNGFISVKSFEFDLTNGLKLIEKMSYIYQNYSYIFQESALQRSNSQTYQTLVLGTRHLDPLLSFAINNSLVHDILISGDATRYQLLRSRVEEIVQQAFNNFHIEKKAEMVRKSNERAVQRRRQQIQNKHANDISFDISKFAHMLTDDLPKVDTKYDVSMNVIFVVSSIIYVNFKNRQASSLLASFGDGELPLLKWFDTALVKQTRIAADESLRSLPRGKSFAQQQSRGQNAQFQRQLSSNQMADIFRSELHTKKLKVIFVILMNVNCIEHQIIQKELEYLEKIIYDHKNGLQYAKTINQLY